MPHHHRLPQETLIPNPNPSRQPPCSHYRQPSDHRSSSPSTITEHREPPPTQLYRPPRACCRKPTTKSVLSLLSRRITTIVHHANTPPSSSRSRHPNRGSLSPSSRVLLCHAQPLPHHAATTTNLHHLASFLAAAIQPSFIFKPALKKTKNSRNSKSTPSVCIVQPQSVATSFPSSNQCKTYKEITEQNQAELPICQVAP
ncbi:hypothetical protein LR48_Vigan10g166100 [Vigna angularis]|uniref:Uncharacterized protein n=1 Tax=Phaseolus angularis TaxID=3914 RepID=A0A0L9VLZ8_PHAAN|nr:hypothetical protein LR48_Vigan10g166100 [Vigna angularis]